ncbi:MAG: tRNA uridine-5-carboxymethylaminomethyl(34) synthesis GTPase MnmE [Clostridia bacterium]|nr:tRNA uridine-5-carboxymethylaminomethyl(34) synthesis GTPase MnmE [Clostridia bacterium]
MLQNGVIAAYSGGKLPGAIGIVRMSGDGVLDIMDRIFKPKRKKLMSECNSNEMIYGELLAADGICIDICLACVFRGPHSYTGEDMAEIYCHGSEAIVSAALRSAYACGARPAEAGEFTKRGFMNGKMDLAAAEAVADLIYAQTEQGAKNAAALLKGHHAKPLAAMKERLLGLIAHFYAVCDYSDEDIEPFEYQEAARTVAEDAKALEKLYQGYLRSAALNDGISVAVVGKPNVGKSSLFNCLAGFERAIVTDEAGTTRDVVGHRIALEGQLFNLMDTAGIREGAGLAESMGIGRSYEAAEEASLVVAVFDGSRPLDGEDREILALCKDKNAVAVINKTDLEGCDLSEVREAFGDVLELSAKAGTGVDELTAWLLKNAPDETEILITGERQAALIRAAAEALRDAQQSAELGLTADAFLLDAERAARLIGQVLGDDVDIDIAHGIFSRFCVGK